MKILFIFILVIGLTACAGPNPNPGERTVDEAWARQDYETVLNILMPAAKREEPWALLRMGVVYELGIGVEKDIPTAIRWYEKAARYEADGDWANGRLIGDVGKVGFFNQTSDALIAKYQLANIYYRGDGIEQDLVKAYELAYHVSKQSNGESIFYCCEFSGGTYITTESIEMTLNNIKKAL